jgi:hypothetical protein
MAEKSKIADRAARAEIDDKRQCRMHLAEDLRQRHTRTWESDNAHPSSIME